MKALVAVKRDETFETFFTKENISFAESLGDIIWLDAENVTEDELKENIKDCDLYLTCWGSPPLTPQLLENAPKLKLHTHLGSTVVPVVCDEVFEQGIKVISGFDYYSKSTAEGVVAYALSFLRKIPFYSSRLKNQKIWRESDDYTDGVIGKKVGIVGFGGVGRYVAKMLSNFDVDISAYDIAKLSEQDKKVYGVEQCGIEEIFSNCDIISLNLPYNDSTYHIVDDALLSKIKDGAVLINTARGAIINESALISHLQKGRFNAVLDVYEKEPIDMENPLLSMDNVLLLPHQAGPTVNLRAVITHNLLKESADFIDNNLPLKNEISVQKEKLCRDFKERKYMLNSPYKKPYITPPAEHPRVMFREADRQRILNNLSHAENRRAYELWKRICKKDFCDFYDDITIGKYNLMVCLMIESKAFEAWVEESETKARSIIDYTKKIVEYFSTDRNVNLMFCRYVGHLVFVTSLVYDWLYKYIKEEEKQYFISKCEQFLEAGMEVGYPPTKQRNTHSHSHEAQYLRDMLAFSIATYNERPDIYDFVVGRIIDDLVPFYKFSFSAGIHNQGASYGAYRQVSVLWAQLLIYQMSGQKIFDECVESADCYYYLTRSDGENLRIADDCHDDKEGGHAIKHPFTIINFFAAALTGNETYRKYYFENYRDEVLMPTNYGMDLYKTAVYGEGLYSPVSHLIFSRLTEPFTPEPYEKARYFPYPAGITIYKDEEKKTTVYMKIGELWCQGHEHYDVGDFQIYHNGILASSSGAYYWYGCEHFYNYDTRTSSHNCLTVRDPNVKTLGQITEWGKTFDYINDGGTRMPKPTTDYDFEPDLAAAWQRDCQMAKVLSHTETDEKVEIVGDLSMAYPDTAERIIRKMTFLPKEGENGVFTVEDEVVAKSEEFIKCFHIHMMEEPQIEGNVITIKHKGGKLRCTVIEPENASITAIGGGDNRFTIVGIPIPSEKTENRECGWGKVIISPSNKAKTHKFKVQMEILDLKI